MSLLWGALEREAGGGGLSEPKRSELGGCEMAAAMFTR